MDVIVLSSGSDEDDSDVEVIETGVGMRGPPLDVTAAPLLVDLTEPRWSPHWLKFRGRATGDVMEVLDFVNGTGNAQTDHATQTLAPNGGDVDRSRAAVTPKAPRPFADDSKRLSPCATQMEKVHLAAEWPKPPQGSLFSNNLQLKMLVEKYFGQREKDEERGDGGGGAHQSTPDDELICTPQRIRHGSVAGDVVEVPRGAREDRPGTWSPVSEAPSPVPFPLSPPEPVCRSRGGSVTEPPESSPSDTERRARGASGQASLGWTLKSEDLPGTDGLGLNLRPDPNAVLRYPECLTSSGSCRGVKSPADETPVTVDDDDAAARAESLVGVRCKLEEKDSGRSGSAENLFDGIPCDSKTWFLPEAMTESYCIDEIDSPVLLVDWRDESDEEDMFEEEKSFRGAGQEDRCYVYPVRLQQLIAHTASDQGIDENEDGRAAQLLSGRSLRLVYTTMEESLPEGTVQLLSDLLQPGSYPPKDITTHLLRGILLGPRCPLHLCVQAFNLLMRTQRHHRADKSTIPWDWELLTSVMDIQGHATRQPCEVVRMLLEYVVQTMDDDFRAKLFPDVLKQSIAGMFLSCSSQFTKVRYVRRWVVSSLFSLRSRMVSVFQRMLHMALEVDRSPVLSLGKLSQELFHVLLIVVPQRSHRKLLLDSLQSELLKCKLLQHLLEHSCPEKTTLPMSLSLLLHFLKNSTPSQEPTDGSQRWPKWEELIDLLWMLLLSYNKVNKGDLRRPITEIRGCTAIATANDVVSRLAVCDAVESMLSRSRADLGQSLPDHIEESLSYLQDHLLEVCQP
ncbi:unnamed protein product [Merluccius merluccius]